MTVRVQTFPVAKGDGVIIAHKGEGGNATLTLGEGHTFASVQVTTDILLEVAAWLDQDPEVAPVPAAQRPSRVTVRITGRSQAAIDAAGVPWPPASSVANTGRGLSHVYRVTGDAAASMVETILDVRAAISGSTPEGARTRGSLQRDADRILDLLRGE